MNSTPLRRLFSFTTLLGSALAMAGLLLASSASAATVTITFENGAGQYDPAVGLNTLGEPNDWLEDGTRYEGFWFDAAGRPWGTENPDAHTHIGNGNSSSGGASSGYTVGDELHSWRNGLQGGLVTLQDGMGFNVVSIDYRLTYREAPNNVSYQQEVLPYWSFADDDIHLLVSSDAVAYAPDFATFEGYWDAYSIDDGSVFDNGDGTFNPKRPANGVLSGTVFPVGLTNITNLYIAHTGARVIIDNIVLEVGSGVGGVIPEPNVAMLLGVGLLALAGRRYRVAA